MAVQVTAGAPASTPNESRRPRWRDKRYLTAGAAALIVVLVIGAVVHYRSGRDRRRYEAILTSSLDRLVTAQEGFYYDSTRYTGSLRALPSVSLPAGVHVQIYNPERRSWWGVATHDHLPARRCVVWVGTAPNTLPADARAPEEEAKPICFDDASGRARQASHS